MVEEVKKDFTIAHNERLKSFVPHAPGKVSHKDTPNSQFELLTPEEHRARHGMFSTPRSRIENYLVQEIERAKKEYHEMWNCEEDGTEADSLEKALGFVRKVYGENK